MMQRQVRSIVRSSAGALPQSTVSLMFAEVRKNYLRLERNGLSKEARLRGSRETAWRTEEVGQHARELRWTERRRATAQVDFTPDWFGSELTLTFEG
jgi:hypothetical protein